jgi:alpha-L-rhamnosidase
MKPFTLYHVHVEATGTSGDRAEATACFETGRLDTPWKAKWITDSSYEYPEKVSPVPMTFRFKFPVTKTVRRAWVNATALGIYELPMTSDPGDRLLP